MEKLQQALESARARRGAAPLPSALPTVAAPRGARGPSVLSEAWAELRKVTLDPAHLIRHRVVSSSADEAAVPFDILRTKIQLNMSKNGWKRLAITSPSPACGKTTIACNLALGFARQTDLRVILFEFDLRRPNMDKLLGLSAGGDIAGMLTGRIPFAEHAVRLHGNVALAIAGRAAHDPGTILISQETVDRLAEIDKTYQPDLMIFDLPPLLVNEDARAFLRNIDCALMVAAAERSTVSEIDLCEREIAEHCNVLGVVLNQCQYADESMGYGDYYQDS